LFLLKKHPMKLAFRNALAIVAKGRRLTTADRAHLNRWRADEYADDPSWERLATAARVRGLLPPGSVTRRPASSNG
jgi:hypothetical protein